MSESAERRVDPRRPTYGKARVGKALLAYIRNLSVGGARLSVVTDVSIEPGQSYPARLILTEGPHLEIDGQARVMWVKRVGAFYDVGVRFTSADESGLEAARDSVEQLGAPDDAAEPMRGVLVELIGEQGAR